MPLPRKPRQSQSANRPKETTRNSSRAVANKKDVGVVTQELRHLIATQEIPPGSKLNEVFLSEKYGISRSRVRDVLSTLEQRGLVERIPNRGAIVVRLDISQIFDLYEVREVLEGLCIRLATIRGDSKKWQSYLKEFNGHLENCVKQGDIDQYIVAYEKFHADVVASTGNQILAEILDSIFERTQTVIRRTIILPGRAAQGLKQHQAVLTAMCESNPEKAEQARRETMRSAKSYIERYQKYVL
jgi:DNA-binding GntR family transcriptional regulator